MSTAQTAKTSPLLASTGSYPAQRVESQKIESIQALRGVAAMAVVALHAMAIERKYSGGDVLLPDWFRFGESGVDLFFVISGFVMVTVTRGRFGRLHEVLRFAWSRVTRIYPTYWFYFFVTLGVFLWQPAWVNSSLHKEADLWASFLLLPSDTLPLVMVAWSLVNELWFYLVFAILLFFPEKALLPSLCVWAAAILGINLFLDTSAFTPTALIMSHPLTCEFIIGSLVALFVRAEFIAQAAHRTLLGNADRRRRRRGPSRCSGCAGGQPPNASPGDRRFVRRAAWFLRRPGRPARAAHTGVSCGLTETCPTPSTSLMSSSCR